MKFGIGQSAVRREDDRLTTGRGCYTDDVAVPGQAYGVVVRSPHAHARIRTIDATAAAAHPGVLTVLTAADAAADGLGTQPAFGPEKNRDGTPSARPPHHVLAPEIVRHVGDPVAFVVADTLAAAQDAAEMVEVDYEPLAAVVDTASALSPDAPLVWAEVPRNLCLDWEQGDAAATAAAFERAAHVVTLELVNNRVVVMTMEPRAALGAYDPDGGRYTLTVCSQGVHAVRGILAYSIFNLPEDRFHVITPDVGGGFGMKGQFFSEYALVLWAARRLGRPVKWTSGRSEAFVSDIQGRDHVTRARLALDGDGRMLGLHVDTIASMGAYLSTVGPLIPTQACAGMHTGVYAIPVAHNEVKCVFTHTVPVDAYRGAGRPEATYMIERLVDLAAREIGLDPAELRRRNFIAPTALPYRTALGLTYDSGEFDRTMEQALSAADRAGFPARRAQSAARGRRRGLGVAYYIETCAGPLLGSETATLRVGEDNRIAIHLGTQSSGQGHETAFAQVAADRLGIEPERFVLVQGDSDRVPASMGTAGSRSLTIGGNAVILAADDLVEKGRRPAADLLEVAATDLRYADGAYTVAGTDRRISLLDAATAVRDRTGAEALAGIATWAPSNATYPNGCHVCEIEIDPDTGRIDILGYTVVDDFGRVINPLLLAGQVHGGIAQGLGQAIMETTLYDPDSGQLLTGSLMDYAVPRAEDMPDLRLAYNEILCPSNALGTKGAGEAGTVGAPPALINAVVDALAADGVRHIDMPATPERVWRALHGTVAG